MLLTVFLQEFKTIFTSKVIWFGTILFFILHGLTDPYWGSSFNFVLMSNLAGVLAIQLVLSWQRDQASSELLFMTQVDSYNYVVGKYLAYALTGSLLCVLCFLGGVFFAADGADFTKTTFTNLLFIEHSNFPIISLYHGILYHLWVIALLFYICRWKRIIVISAFLVVFMNILSIIIVSLIVIYRKHYGSGLSISYLWLSIPPFMSITPLGHIIFSPWWLLSTIPFVLLMLNLTVQNLQKEQPSILMFYSVHNQKTLSRILLGIWLCTEIGFSYFVVYKIMGI